jgi:hypothetical protein
MAGSLSGPEIRPLLPLSVDSHPDRLYFSTLPKKDGLSD